MRKFALLIVCTFIFTSCEIDDDGPTMVPVHAKVENAILPEYFEKGETYEVDVTYLLPDACHQDVGLSVTRGGETGEEYRDIYVFAIATHDINLTECNQEDVDLEKTRGFSITIDKEDPYTFYLWTGIDENDENVFTEIEVPVGAPTDGGENTEE